MKMLLQDAAATARAGAALANAFRVTVQASGGVVFLTGDLGAGKSSLVRGWLEALGVEGPMPSPTYSLVEHYPGADEHVINMDAYRLSDAEELDYLGVIERLGPGTLLLVEWPGKVADALPAPSLELALDYCDAKGNSDGRPLSARMLSVLPSSETAQWRLRLAEHSDEARLRWTHGQGDT